MELIHIASGTVLHKVDDGAGKALLLALPEAFKRTEPKPAPTHNVQPPSGARWGVRNHPLSGNPELVFTALNQEHRYPGPNCFTPTAEGAQQAFTACGHPVPADVLHKFSELLERARSMVNNPDAVIDARERLQNAQYSREQKERAAQQKLAGE